MYFVRTQSEVNEMNLHHNGEPYFESESLVDALRVFEKEIVELSKCYIHQFELNYAPTNDEQSHAVFCEITTINEDGDIDVVRSSDYYYEKKASQLNFDEIINEIKRGYFFVDEWCDAHSINDILWLKEELETEAITMGMERGAVIFTDSKEIDVYSKFNEIKTKSIGGLTQIEQIEQKKYVGNIVMV